MRALFGLSFCLMLWSLAGLVSVARGNMMEFVIANLFAAAAIYLIHVTDAKR